jgi:hypothetical protein
MQKEASMNGRRKCDFPALIRPLLWHILSAYSIERDLPNRGILPSALIFFSEPSLSTKRLALRMGVVE